MSHVTILPLIFLTFSLNSAAIGDSSINDSLFEKFVNPSAESKPFTRWWWGGNLLNSVEIERELDVFKEAGLGGVEINPAGDAFRPIPSDHIEYTWLSPEWCDLVKFTSEEAKKRGLLTDLIGGTGWPYGGEFLKPEEQIQTIYTHYYKVQGGQNFEKTFRELSANAHIDDSKYKQKLQKGEFVIHDLPNDTCKPKFATLIPASPNQLSDLKDVTSSFGNDGSLKVSVPQGNFVLAVGIWKQGEQVRKVGVSVKGGGGPVLDHFAHNVPSNYFNRMSDALGASFGAPMGNFIRSMFVDSIELRSANWTDDFENEFEKRVGYDIRPWLPIVMSEKGGALTVDNVNFQAELLSKVRRVCYDRNIVICELYQERFVSKFHDWCNDNGMLSRYQSYGAPWLLDLGNTSMMVDIPESNDWLTDRFSHGWGIWHKYTSSAANLRGLKVASSESMTNTKKTYAKTLGEMKTQMDLNFVLGINHAVWHGTSYSPPELRYPGKALFGSFFNERNPWWPWFKSLNNYTARLSSVFQNTKPVAQFAILPPTADLWSDYGLSRNVYHKTPPYLQRLVESIGQNGGSADYITEKVLQNSEVKNGKLCFGPMTYSVIIVAEAQTIDPKTALMLRNFVDNGGQLVLLGDVLNSSSGFKNALKNDGLVADSKNRIINNPNCIELNPPVKDLLGWVENTLLPSISIELPLKFANPNYNLHQLHRIDKENEIYFFSNQSLDRNVVTDVTFKSTDKKHFVWNPHNAKSFSYPSSGNKIQLKLGPQESLLIVRKSSNSNSEPKYHTVNLSMAEDELQTLTGKWNCVFSIIESDSFERSMDLVDLSKSSDSSLSSFAGTVSYSKKINGLKNKTAILDLGEVHGISEVFLNGKQVGTRWFGQHRYSLNEILPNSKNTLAIKVTTVALNYIKSLPIRPRHQVDKQSLVSTGLVGPVRSLKSEDSL